MNAYTSMKDQQNATTYKETVYDDAGRFRSYYFQIKYITALNPESILEIGVGNKTLVNYLREHNFKIYSCDIDPNLNPDYVGDIRKLPFKDNEFDVVCAFQILEHIPWEDVPAALSELKRVSRKNVIFSIPYTPVSIEMVLKSSIIKRLFNTWTFNIFFNLAFITRPWKYDGVHYWEMGKKNFSRKKVRNLVNEYFTIIEEKRVDLSYQYFFVLGK
jgi:SAM-dependent methyltransferase